MKSRFLFSLFLIISFTISCSPRIVGYKKGECLTDPKTGTCRPVCRWKLKYMLRNKTDCMRAKYGCLKGEYLFGSRRGCGCARPVFCDKN